MTPRKRLSDGKLPIRMLHDRVLVSLEQEGERKSSAGILIPATAQMGRRLAWAKVVAVGANVRTVEVGDRVLFDPEDRAEVVVRSRRYLLDGKPMETAVSYIPADLARGTPISDPNPGPGGIYARLEEQGHTLARFTEDVAARMPTPEEAKVLALRPGVPVFRLVRTAYDVDGRAVEVCDTVMAADAYQLSYELPAH